MFENLDFIENFLLPDLSSSSGFLNHLLEQAFYFSVIGFRLVPSQVHHRFNFDIDFALNV